MIDTRQYIESGILEDYLSGTLTPSERTEVEATADKYPEIAQELASMSLSLSVMADIGEIVPATYMEERIWNEILNTNLVEQESAPELITPLVQKPSKLPYIMTVAMAILAFVTIYYMIIANNRLEEAQAKITTIEQANTDLKVEYDNLKYDYDSLSTLSSVYDFDNSKMYVMKTNRRNAGEAIVILIWNKETNKLYLDIKQLPNTNAGKKYTLWGITQIGRQVDLGSFVHSGKSQVVELRGIRDAIRYIVTQERETGVSYPTMTSVYTTTDLY